MKYAAIIKHMFRDDHDIRVDIYNIPKEIENIGPYEIKKYVERNLLGNFEVICVTDRISENDNYQSIEKFLGEK